MTNEEFDKRMDRLTERHEAMAVSMELLQSTVHELSGTMRSLVQPAPVPRKFRACDVVELQSMLDDEAQAAYHLMPVRPPHLIEPVRRGFRIELLQKTYSSVRQNVARVYEVDPPVECPYGFEELLEEGK